MECLGLERILESIYHGSMATYQPLEEFQVQQKGGGKHIVVLLVPGILHQLECIKVKLCQLSTGSGCLSSLKGTQN